MPPNVHSRECNRLGGALKADLDVLQADLDFIIDVWHREMEQLEEALGSTGLETLLDHLHKLNPVRERRLRAYVNELTGILTTAKVMRQAHRSVKVMQDWDALSQGILKELHAKGERKNVLTTREQALIYYIHSAASLGRAAAFSCYLAGVAGAAIPSLVLAGFITVPAGLHTMIMVRDYFRKQEQYHWDRAQAFENMSGALRVLEDWRNCSMDDALAMLAFRDAVSRLPERAHGARLDAQRAQYAALRDQYFMPANVLSSCIGQILNLVLAPQWSSSLLLGGSSIAYLVQGVFDLLQGDGEYVKAATAADSIRDWLQNKAGSERMQQWAAQDRLNQAVLVGMKAHNERCLRELEPEAFGGYWRKGKAVCNFTNGGLTMAAAALPPFKLLPRQVSTVAGTSASTVSLAYLIGTATKLVLRGNVKEQASHRCLQARILLARLDPHELLARICHNDGRPLEMEIPVGDYDEFSGFELRSQQFRPWENEFVALEALAEAVDLFISGEGEGGDDLSIARIMSEMWNMTPLDWLGMLRVAGSMRNLPERVAFIKLRLAGLLKIDFTLDASQLEPELPAPVLVHAFLQKLETEDYAVLERIAANDEESEYGSTLRKTFRDELQRHGEDAFLQALEEVWCGRKVNSFPTRASLALQSLRVLADHLLAQRRQFCDGLMDQLEGKDNSILISQWGRAAEVKSFIETIRQVLKARPTARAQRREALARLARMELTQALLLEPKRFAKLACYDDLGRVLGLVDIRVGAPELDDDDILVSATQSADSSDHESGPVQHDAQEAGEGESRASLATGPGPALLRLVKRPFHRRRAKKTNAILEAMQGVEQRPPRMPDPPSALTRGTGSPVSPYKPRAAPAPLQSPLTEQTPRRRMHKMVNTPGDD